AAVKCLAPRAPLLREPTLNLQPTHIRAIAPSDHGRTQSFVRIPYCTTPNTSAHSVGTEMRRSGNASLCKASRGTDRQSWRHYLGTEELDFVAVIPPVLDYVRLGVVRTADFRWGVLYVLTPVRPGLLDVYRGRRPGVVARELLGGAQRDEHEPRRGRHEEQEPVEGGSDKRRKRGEVGRLAAGRVGREEVDEFSEEHDVED
ncbi:hypothetical protein THAOC_05168, partial [Thalassiosira oceanica]